MLKVVWIVERSEYDAQGHLTYRAVNAVCVNRERARTVLRAEASGLTVGVTEPHENVGTTPDSVLYRFKDGSKLVQVLRYHVDNG